MPAIACVPFSFFPYPIREFPVLPRVWTQPPPEREKSPCRSNPPIVRWGPMSQWAPQLGLEPTLHGSGAVKSVPLDHSATGRDKGEGPTEALPVNLGGIP